MKNPVTRARVILGEELLEIIELIKKIKKLNYDTVELIAQRLNNSDLYYDENCNSIYYRDEDDYLLELPDNIEHDIEALSKVVELCGIPTIINKFKQMKSLTEKRIFIDNVECISIKPHDISMYIVTIESEDVILNNFYDVWKKVIEYKEFLQGILKHNKKIKNKITILSIIIRIQRLILYYINWFLAT